MQAAYRKRHDALEATGRPILYSLCQYGQQEVWITEGLLLRAVCTLHSAAAEVMSLQKDKL